MKSVMQHQFSQVPEARIERSQFDRSHGHKTTFDAGYLIPVYVDEGLPGDSFNLRMNAFARLATPIKAPMDNMYLDSFFFAVPVRLVWDDFTKFMGEKDDPDSTTSYVVPQMTETITSGAAKLSNYMGIPGSTAGLSQTFNSLWHRAYQLIWNTWFRDQNLQDAVVVDKDAGPDTATDYELRRRNKRHDYFTSCLPWPQKSEDLEDVTLPLGTTAPVISTGDPISLKRNTQDEYIYAENGATTIRSQNNWTQATGQLVWGANSGLEANLEEAIAPTINDLREAFQLQRLYERNARGGTRYTEIIKAHFMVTSPDARLQRPEYLGGGRSYVNVHPIAQTSVSATTPQGNIAGFGTVSINGHGFTKSFTEHVLLIGLVCLTADLTYQQGLNRMFSRRTKYDFYWPTLAHLGEQEVLNKEIQAQHAQPNGVFGYQERFAEYRYKPSLITGLFNSDASTPLDMWHLAQDLAANVGLNSAFIEENPPVDRIIVTASEPHLLFDSYFDLKCARPMPVYSIPGMMDHF